MKNRISYYFIIFFLLWAGCSGTEFPNPGSSDDDEIHVTGETNTSGGLIEEVNASADLQNQRFYQYIFNECVQVMVPDDQSELEANFMQIGTEDTEPTQHSSLIGEIPLSFTAIPITGDENSFGFTIFVEDIAVDFVTFGKDGEFIGNLLPSESAPNVFEFKNLSVENCQQVLDAEEILVLNGESISVQHQQWSYHDIELSPNITTIIDIYLDRQEMGLQRTVQFGLTFREEQETSSSDDAEPLLQLETYLFQLQKTVSE